MDYSNWKVTDLKDKLREIGQPVSGKKIELIERLQRANGTADPNAGRLVIDIGKASSSKSTTNSQYDSMTIPQLKAELTKYKLPTTCKRKEELIQRLESYMECQLVGPINFTFIRNRPLEILMVAEKPSMAQELANVLAQGRRIHRSSSSNDAIPIFRFPMHFHGYEANVWMTSTLGHIFTQDFGKEVTKKQIEELFEAEVVNTEAMPEKKIPKMLAEIGKGADAVVLWLDCDLEGESICFEVIDCIKNVINKPPSGNVMDVIYRAKFSSSDEALSAINNLIKPNFRHHLSAIAKHDLDLRVGVPFSRYQTYILRRAFPDRNIEHLSFGPCQSPCLHFCVQQYEKLQNYVPVFTSHIVLTLDLGRYELEITSDPIKNENEADRIYKKLKDEQKCQVVSVERTSHVKEPPKALNTVELLKDASKYYGIGPSEAMQAAEQLYTSGLISYPRTETTRYPKTLSLQERKNKLRRAAIDFKDEEEPMDWESELVESERVYERGEDKGDHPPICPTGKAVFRPLTEVQKIIYELVCRRFFASWMPDQEYLSEVVEFEAADMILKRRIQEVNYYGFSKLLPWEKVVSTRDVPTGLFKNGSKIKIKNVKVVKTKSTAPTLLSESELIEKMEKNNIGTDASIPGHISNIQRRNYVRVNEDTRTLEPTKLGIQLIQAYRQCIPKLVETSLRAEFEQQIAKIAKGEREFEEARRFILEAFKEQFKLFRNNFSKFTQNFNGCFELKTDDNYQTGSHRNKLQFTQQKQLPSTSSAVPDRKIIHPSRNQYSKSQFVIGNAEHARSAYRTQNATSSQEFDAVRKPGYGRPAAYRTQHVADLVRKPNIAEVPSRNYVPEPRGVKRGFCTLL